MSQCILTPDAKQLNCGSCSFEFARNEMVDVPQHLTHRPPSRQPSTVRAEFRHEEIVMENPFSNY